MSYYDILTADAIKEILDWLTIEHSNMAALDHFGPDVRRVPYALSSLGFGQAVEPHDVLVIGQDQFLPPARDIVWDCRGFSQGLPAVPIQWTLMPLLVLTFRARTYNACWNFGRIKSF